MEANEVVKTFRVLKKKPGLIGSVAAFFSNTYETVRAVDRIDFRIEPGELVGYIGANGAGKSTTVKLLAGILEPSAGTVSILGRNPCRERVANARDIGVVFGQKSQLWWDLPVIESYHLIKEIYEVPSERYRRDFDAIVNSLGLADLLHKPVRSMSLGQRTRCDLAAPFLHSPKIVYLDEPTIGLDVAVKAAVRSFLKSYCRENGVTLFMTTHDLRDIEEVCDRVILIDRGHKLYDGTVPGLRRTFGDRRRLHLELREPFRREEFERDFAPAKNGIEVDSSGLEASITFDPDKVDAMRIVQCALAQNRVHDFTLEDAPVEEIVRRVYGESEA